MNEKSPFAVNLKWREAAIAGFQPVPDILLRNQSNLGLTDRDVVVLLNISMHWWHLEQRPFPRATTIAHRMGVATRTVQRSLARLIDLGLLRRMQEKLPTGETRTVCDLSGLVDKLCELAKTDTAFLARTEGKKEPGGAERVRVEG